MAGAITIAAQPTTRTAVRQFLPLLRKDHVRIGVSTKRVVSHANTTVATSKPIFGSSVGSECIA